MKKIKKRKRIERVVIPHLLGADLSHVIIIDTLNY